MRILAPSPKEGGWEITEEPFSVEALADLPKQCYVFLDVADYQHTDGRRERILSHFGVPAYVANRTCFEINGFFGSKASYGDGGDLSGYSTWFRTLVKMVRKVPEDAHDDAPEYATGKKDYKWFEMTFFSRWCRPTGSQGEGATAQVLCVDTPFDFIDELKKLLEKDGQLQLDLRDPFALHTSLVDQVVVYADISVWRVRDPVRRLEKTRLRLGAIFNPIHEMNRHAIHTTEVLEASIDTLTALQERRAAVHERLGDRLGEEYRERARDYGEFQLSLVKNLKLRSQSNQERLKDEIDLAFNNLSRQDNDVQKSIAVLTMVFLPATFISAVFSTTFYNFGEDGTWEVSPKQWIYWATTIPATILSVFIWQMWVSHSDSISRVAGNLFKWPPTLGQGKREKKKGAATSPAGKVLEA
ncbi:hypothetical protein VTJ49DRAFT_1345 [Mycothermus thermophilus]|uniref:Uncharacterized protein n=1 Tax=Humicola insolens TaxID=85995 RepID=A0ABR3VNK9_HUMIN